MRHYAPQTLKSAGSWNSETTPHLGRIGTLTQGSTQRVGPRRIHRRTTLLGHHLKAHGVSPPPPLDSPRIRVCFAVEGDIVPPSHSKTLPSSCRRWNLRCTACADRKPPETRLIPATQVRLGHQPRPQLATSSRIGPSTRASAHPARSDWVLDASHTNANNDFIYRRKKGREEVAHPVDGHRRHTD